MKKTNSQRIQHGKLKRLAETLKIARCNLSLVLSGQRAISKKKAKLYAERSKALGYDFTAVDWMFNPEKIKDTLATPPGTQEAS